MGRIEDGKGIVFIKLPRLMWFAFLSGCATRADYGEFLNTSLPAYCVLPSSGKGDGRERSAHEGRAGTGPLPGSHLNVGVKSLS